VDRTEEPPVSIIYVSHFQPKPVTIEPPSIPLTDLGHVACGYTFYGLPAPARRAVYRYALVDQHDRLSPWSDPVEIDHPEGGGVFTTLTDYVPDDPDVCAVCWEIDGELAMAYFGGVSPFQVYLATPAIDRHKVRPWCPLTPAPITDLRKGGGFWDTKRWGESLVLREKPPTPVLREVGIRNTDLEVAYCWVAANRETALSPPCKSPRRTDYAENGVGYRRLFMANVQPPPGATAYCVFVRSAGHPWFFAGQFPLDCMQPVITEAWARAHVSDVAPVTLSPLQQALDARQSGDVVVVDVPVAETTVPIIDRWGPTHTKIVGLHGMPWAIKYTGGGDVALLCQSSYTTWEGMTVEGGTRATSNFSGGQAFGHTYRDCWFLDSIRTLDNSTFRPGDHTESETLFDSCHIHGPVAVRLEGLQTASVRFRRCHVVSDTARKPGTACLWIDTPCKVVFENGLFADWGSRLAYLGARARLALEDVFVDQGHSVFFEGTSYYPATVYVNGNQLNAPTVAGKLPWLARGGVACDLRDVPPGRWRVQSTQENVPVPVP
jgi:hypothetical protein